MAGEVRAATDSVSDRAVATAQPGAVSDGEAILRALTAAPFSFSFFAAVRRLESIHRTKPRVGYSSHVSEDPVRFGQVPSLAFAPSTVAEYKPRGDGRAPRMAVHFFGLMGANGPMPLHFTEYVRDRELNQDDSTVARFLDVFHHRMVALFYRAWACNQQTVSHDRASIGWSADRWAAYVGSLFGIGMAGMLDRDAAPDIAKLHYSGRLVCHTRNAEGLESIIADFFGVPTQLDQFVGQWLALPEGAGCRLGASRESGTIGESVVVGSRVWDCQQKFRLQLGPMSFAEYQRMLPGGNSLRRLVAWVKNYVGDELEWDSRLILKKEEIPKLTLGKVGQLGWSTWVHSKPMPRDADDLVLRGSAAA
jgi:type VI secretion system protein ImpH